MQYILTQEEMDNLVPKKQVEDRDKALSMLRDMVLKGVSVKCWRDEPHHYGYCDKCPLAPLYNPASLREVTMLLCDRPKEYSK